MEGNSEAGSCWYCGNRIGKPKYRVRENVRSFGVPSGTITTSIHKSCYNKAVDEGYGHYLTFEVIK